MLRPERWSDTSMRHEGLPTAGTDSPGGDADHRCVEYEVFVLVRLRVCAVLQCPPIPVCKHFPARVTARTATSIPRWQGFTPPPAAPAAMSMRHCSRCHEFKSQSSFSRKQWKQKGACSNCIGAAAPHPEPQANLQDAQDQLLSPAGTTAWLGTRWVAVARWSGATILVS